MGVYHNWVVVDDVGNVIVVGIVTAVFEEEMAQLQS